MKKIVFLFVAIAAYSLVACNGNNAREHKSNQLPKPGVVVAEASMPVTGDALNHFTYSVKVIADSNIKSGEYDVDADYGPNFAEGHFTMPTGCIDAKPVIRKGPDPYTFIIGFKIAGDTAFYEYFEVKSNRNAMQMRYIKSYTF